MAKTGTTFRSQVQYAVTFALVVFEIAYVTAVAPNCGKIELIGGHKEKGDEDTKRYQLKTLDVVAGTGASSFQSDFCWSNISNSDVAPQNLAIVVFQPNEGNCELLFCGTFTGSNNANCYNLGNGRGEQNSDTKHYYKLFSGIDFNVASITCGCPAQNSSENCTQDQCGNVYDDNISGLCASVHFESNCASCLFLPEQLNENENVPFHSCHAASVKSLVIKPGYEVIRSRKGGFEKTYSKSISFNEAMNTMFSPIGEDYVCRKIPEDKEKEGLSVGLIVMIVLGFACLLTVLVGGIFLERHMRKRHFRNQFVQMIQDLKASETGVNTAKGSSTGSYLYDPKFELNRTDLKLNLSDPSKVLGVGTFGKVIQGKLVTKDEGGSEKLVEVAVKTFHALDAVVNMNHIKALINEIRVMSFIENHPNIVQFFGAHIDLRGGHIFCVMELCSKKSLLGHLISLQTKSSQQPANGTMRIGSANENGYSALEKDDKTSATFETEEDNSTLCDLRRVGTEQAESGVNEFSNTFKAMVKWSCDISSGMAFLQQSDVLHIDLAARNILLTSDNTAKISDFGLSKRLYTSLDEKSGDDRTQQTYKKSSGLDLIPYKYIALESLLLGDYSSKSDVWSFGITLWEIFSCGLEPYGNISEPRVLQMFLQSGKRLASPEHATNEIYCKMLSCWTDEPHLRPDFKDLLPFFNAVYASLAA